MSGREFKFGDRVIAENIGPRSIGVIVDVDGGPKDRPIVVCFSGCSHKFCHAPDELKHADPSAQPHVAAGRGWKERMLKAIYDQCCAYDGGGYEAAVKAIDALLDEVVEMPEPDPYWVFRSDEDVVIGRANREQAIRVDPSEALPLAAALIRAAITKESPAQDGGESHKE